MTLIHKQDDYLAQLQDMDTPKLRAELARGLSLTAASLTNLAMIWGELERRGEDLSDLRTGVARTLPLIASGMLAAESVVAFAGRPLLLRALEGVSLDIQRRLADGETIPVYLPGEAAPSAMPLSRIPSAVVTRVIANGIIRTPAEQRLATREKRQRRGTQRDYTVTVDRDARTIKIGKMVVPLSTIIAAMAEAGGATSRIIDWASAPAKTVSGKVTDDEKERVKAAAKAHGMEEGDMVRQAVVAMWLL